ncbi:MAG: sulfotransferase, partial [Sphingomonadaceae bacterium]|nr:sulfotransferase [Sphingomonadaceae bacterium]
ARAAAERRRDGITTFPQGAAEALRDYARGLVAKAGARPSAWGLKLPEAMMVLPELNEAFPGMRLIHLVRHPVAIALRRTHVTSRSNNPVGAAVLEAAYREADLAERLDGPRPPWMDNVLSWIFQVGPASRFGREVLGPERYLEIRYEDLCADQEAQEARISDFLGRRVALGESLSAEAIRPPGYAPDDPRIEHIWPLCRRTARPLGYERDLPGDASDDAARARA